MSDRNNPNLEPSLTVTSSTTEPAKHSSSETAVELMLYANLLQQEKLLSAAVGAFNNEKERIDKTPEPQTQEEFIKRYGTLNPLRDAITNYQDKIRDLLRTNNISPTTNPSLYNMYVDGFDVADEILTSQRIDALQAHLNSDDALTTNAKFPSVSEMRDNLNRRRDTDEDDTPAQAEQPDNTPSPTEQPAPSTPDPNLTPAQQQLRDRWAGQTNPAWGRFDGAAIPEGWMPEDAFSDGTPKLPNTVHAAFDTAMATATKESIDAWKNANPTWWKYLSPAYFVDGEIPNPYTLQGLDVSTIDPDSIPAKYRRTSDAEGRGRPPDGETPPDTTEPYTYEDLQQQLTQSQSDLAAANASIEDWKQKVLDKQALLDQAGQNLQTAMASEAADEATIARLRQQLTDAQTSLDSANSGLANSQQQLAAAQQQNTDLQGQLTTAQQQLGTTQQQLGTTQEQLEAAQQADVRDQAEIDRLQGLLDAEASQNVQDATTAQAFEDAKQQLAQPRFSHLPPPSHLGSGHPHGHDLNAGGRTEPSKIEHQDTYSGIVILEEVLKGFKFLLLNLIKKKFPVAGIGISVLNRFLPKEISEVAIHTVALMMSAPRSNKFLRGGHRPDLRDNKHITKRLVENPSIFPLLIIGLKTYFEYLGLGSISVSFLQMAIKAVFGYVVGFQSKDKEWFTFVIDNFPNQISIEYKRHGDKIGEQDPNYEQIVTNYRMDLVKKYKKIYGTDLYKDLEKIEGSNGIGIVSMFKLLHTPAKLHELNSLFKSLESSMTNLGVGGLVGLIGVAYAELTDKGELDNVELLSNLKVVGIVKYVKQTETQMPNIDTQIMLDMAKPADQRGMAPNLQGYTIVPKMNLETVAVYKNNMDDYQIVFRGTRTDIQSFLTQDLQRNVLNLAGSPELFNREPYAKNYRMADEFLQRIYMRNPRSVIIQGYSLGGIGALFLASKHNVKTNVYNPILGNNEQTLRLFKKIKEIGNNNINIYYIPSDPISVNVPLYEGYGVRLNKVPKSKFHNAHSMRNF